MDMKITVDNNFFDAYYASSSEDRASIEKAALNKKILFYPNIQLLSELLGLYDTTRSHLLQPYSALLLTLMGNKIFNDWNVIIGTELGIIKDKNAFLDLHLTIEFKEILYKLLQGDSIGVIDEVLGWVNNYKQNMYDVCVESRKRAQKVGLSTKGVGTFEEFYQMPVVIKWKEDLTRRMFSRSDIQPSIAEIKNIVDNSKKFPYFNTYMALELCEHYHHTVKNEEVDFGGSYDIYQLVYTINLDYFITEESRLKRIAKGAFGKQRKVINFKELVAKINSKTF
ncbi:MAG: hypothetical protein A3I73_04010 [Omnitrophica bacterium RIFCSPLOWO2_02_FULL_45_16]|nr:MAG: hypothetical protein A3C51_06125 [Omnitrophica bacterium RIFCSPHIGHO2_02_FULL_46_20]OGX00959.1 MAG: hypothetical protein A3I73_04010 [Omnitrophica bacterium RIFCSPLOWO2_02_FULL_45_16]